MTSAWSRSETADQLLALIRNDLISNDVHIEVDTDLLAKDAIDSLGVVAITGWMEDELGITVPATDVVLDNFRTVTRMLDYVGRRLLADE